MAKLNEVQTVDMVNGEITKVAYDGVEYAKVDSAQVGDIGLVIESWGSQNVGEFYVIKRINDRSNDDIFYHVDGADMSASCYAYKMQPFRKIAVQTPPTLEARVTELETEVAALKGEKANETIEFEGAEYRKVDREAREGDVIVLTQEQADETTYVTAGKPYKVLRHTSFVVDNGDAYDVYFDNFGRTTETVDVYEAVAKPYSPKVGDVVVITANTSASLNSVGDVGKVFKVKSHGARVNVPGKEATMGNFTSNGEFRPATPSEIEAYEKALHKASFEVGDYVKMVKSERGNEGEIVKITDDSVGLKARSISGNVISADFHAEKLDGNLCGLTADQIVKATDAEIAQATAPKLKAGDFVKFTKRGKYQSNDISINTPYEVYSKSNGDLAFRDDINDERYYPLDHPECYEILAPGAAEKAREEVKWAKLNRKVGELKQGDVVRVKDACGAPGFNRGQITEVSAKSTTVSAKVGTGWLVCAELIAPVESLVA